MSCEILVTGKSGTVGSNFDFGTGFRSFHYNLTDYNHAYRLMSDFLPESIIHCAARVGGLGVHIKHKKELFYDNILMNTNLLEVARMHNVRRVLSFLSTCIYSDRAEQPYTEKNIHDFEPFVEHYPYGFAKRMLEIQSRIYYEQYGLKYNCVIPTNVYGPHDDFNIETGHVIGVLVHKCLKAKDENKNFEVWGDGKQEREFIYAKDVAKLTYWALYNYLDKEPLIFSNNQTITIKEIAEIIADTLKFQNRVIFDTSKPTGQVKRTVSGNKLKSLYPEFRFTSIENGIRETVDWFVSNYGTARI